NDRASRRESSFSFSRFIVRSCFPKSHYAIARAAHPLCARTDCYNEAAAKVINAPPRSCRSIAEGKKNSYFARLRARATCALLAHTRHVPFTPCEIMPAQSVQVPRAGRNVEPRG